MLIKALVELIGTFVFLSVILSSVGNPTSIGIALAAMILFGGAISGGHFNPAVTFMTTLNGSIDTTQAIVYVIVQLIGASLALKFYKTNLVK